MITFSFVWKDENTAQGLLSLPIFHQFVFSNCTTIILDGIYTSASKTDFVWFMSPAFMIIKLRSISCFDSCSYLLLFRNTIKKKEKIKLPDALSSAVCRSTLKICINQSLGQHIRIQRDAYLNRPLKFKKSSWSMFVSLKNVISNMKCCSVKKIDTTLNVNTFKKINDIEHVSS